jgi:hypothetical protein
MKGEGEEEVNQRKWGGMRWRTVERGRGGCLKMEKSKRSQEKKGGVGMTALGGL